MIMRAFTVPSVKDARSSAGWALVFIAILYTTAPAVAAMAKSNLHATVNTAVMKGGDLYAPEASIKNEGPPRLDVALKDRLLKWQDKNGDGRIQYYDDKTKQERGSKAKAEAAGWKGNELTVNDIIVLANPEIALLPNWVIAWWQPVVWRRSVHCGGPVDGDFRRHLAMTPSRTSSCPYLPVKGELMAGKVAMAIFHRGRRLPRLNPLGFAAGTVALAFGIAAASCCSIIAMVLKKMNKEGAMAGMLAARSSPCSHVFAHKGIFFIKGTEYLGLIGRANIFLASRRKLPVPSARW